MFTFKANRPEENFQIMKRNFLKKIATLFDPVGFLAPFTIRAEVMMQEMWVAGLEWDELCPRELIHKSQEWFCDLEGLPTIKVPKCLRFGPEEVALSETLHTFVDARCIWCCYLSEGYLREWISIQSTSCSQDKSCTTCSNKHTSFKADSSNPGSMVDRVSFQSLQWWIKSSCLLVR